MSTASAPGKGPSDGAPELRQRLPLQQSAPDSAMDKTGSLDSVASDAVGDKSNVEEKKTYGRTPDGTVFIVPTTHDMVSQLLDPRQPKNASDLFVLGILGLLVFTAYALPTYWKKPVFAAIFLFWRAAYNMGIGYLLHIQSHRRQLIIWARNWKLFEHPETGKQPRPRLYNFLKRELEAKIPHDYQFEKAPIEYNTWLVFRRAVDLILMCDFVSYCLFAIICANSPDGENAFVGIGRWVLGIFLVGFNLWVKLDAHRVVKDFAWYWGDFFYLIDQDLTFDGVFEMAPHPMYSIGYAGYYGISMMAASYEVLFISIVAHIAQFAFLVNVENPHIEKTYNPPAPRKRSESRNQSKPDVTIDMPAPGSVEQAPTSPTGQQTSQDLHKLVGLQNLDLFRVPDVAAILLPGYVAVIALSTPSNSLWNSLFVLHAMAWRVWYHLGLSILLDQQSKSKMWTRHFLKYGESLEEAWRQWKGLHHISMIMCNASFVAACWKLYDVPEDWSHGLVMLRHVLGLSLAALQIWTAFSVYESLGEFGWFCGDFFFDRKAKLTYTSIYRFVNNPDRVFGIAGTWGAALITWSRSIFLLALTAQLLTLFFISYVERPHMQKIYGRSLRGEAGLTKFIKRSLPPPMKEWQQSVDNLIDDTAHFVEDFLDSARPMLASGMKTVVKDTSALFNMAPARLTITRIPADLKGLSPRHYSLAVEGTPSTASALRERATGKESLTARFDKDVKTMVFEYGTPLRVKWRAPASHGRADWIGLYMVTDNRSRDTTEVSSLGRWAPTNSGIYDPFTADSSIAVAEHRVAADAGTDAGPDADLVEGEVVFEGDKLWWTQGVFEFRYHHDGKPTVMSVSEPFEIRVSKFDEEDVDVDSQGRYEKVAEASLLPVVQNCLDRDPDIAPSSVDEPFGAHVERDSKYAKRVVYAIREMFGIEFAAAVVPADGNVRKLAWRICNAKQVLAPYSMSASKGTTTPAG